MVAVRNSKKFEEFNRDRFINYEGEYIVSTDADIEIWSKEPIWDSEIGVYNCRVDNVNTDINLLLSMSVEEFEKKYGIKLDHGEKVVVSKMLND